MRLRPVVQRLSAGSGVWRSEFPVVLVTVGPGCPIASACQKSFAKIRFTYSSMVRGLSLMSITPGKQRRSIEEKEVKVW
jgi:hypothetical protein